MGGKSLADAIFESGEKTVVDLGYASRAGGTSDGVDGDCGAKMRQQRRSDLSRVFPAECNLGMLARCGGVSSAD
jgi:hypothetical protein